MLTKTNSFYRFGKLLKYELLACGRVFVPVYAALLVISLINGFFMPNTAEEFDNGTSGPMATIMYMLYFGLFIASIVINILILIQRFKKNLLGNESYLSLTLPVGIGNHIAAKVVSALIFSFICGVVAVCSVLLLSLQTDLIQKIISEISMSNIWEIFASMTKSQIIFLVIEVPLICLLSLASCTLMVYACMSIGHLAPKYHVFAELISFIVLSTVQSNCMSGISQTIGDICLVADKDISSSISIAQGQGLLYCVVLTVFGAAYFGITYYILSRRINLE